MDEAEPGNGGRSHVGAKATSASIRTSPPAATGARARALESVFQIAESNVREVPVQAE
jgi:hypothetical protein